MEVLNTVGWMEGVILIAKRIMSWIKMLRVFLSRKNLKCDKIFKVGEMNKKDCFDTFVMSKGGHKMKKLFFGAMLLALAISVPIPTMAQVSVRIGIPLPPPIAIPAPPEVILLPHTGVYVAPDLAVDLFFFDGWWWRQWEGHWYQSRDYRSGWGYYNGVPSFYGRVPSGWRDDYRNHRWEGREWHYQRVPHRQLQENWQRNFREQSRGRPEGPHEGYEGRR